MVVALVLASPVAASSFSDDFERADGPVDGWTVNNGDWNIVGGELVGGPASDVEQECFAGDPAIVLPDNYRLSFDIRWIAPEVSGGVGRHAGMMFNFDQVAGRGGGSGYNLWWIDRAGDRGLNLARRDNGAFSHLVMGPGAAAPDAEPPSRWTIEVIGDHIRVYGDGELMIDHVDSTHRGGRFAAWTWNGEGQTVAFDNIVVEGIVFGDDFARSGIADWTVHSGTWELSGDTLVSGPATGGGAAGEHEAFAGSPPLELPESYTASVDWTFLAPADSQPVGRHASLYINFNQPGNRWSGDTTGYQVHWIDRDADRGLNLLRWDGAAIVALQAGTGDLFDAPPSTLRVEVDADNIRVFGDDVLAIDVADNKYRGGNVGLWNWDGAGNHVQWDNFSVTDADGNVIFEDGFAPRPPPLGSWTVHYWIWAGDPPLLSGEDATFEFDLSFLAPGSNATVGRHGGFQFCSSEPTTRAAFSGYFIDWIDRVDDRGVRFTRVDSGGFNEIVRGQMADATADPPTHWKVEVVGETIRVYVDGADEPIIDVVDTTYRGGFFGFWTWSGDQQVAIDNLTVGTVAGSSNLAGDANADGILDIADVVGYVDLQFPGFNLLNSSPATAPCSTDAGNLAVLDLDGNGALDLSDTVFLANYLFASGSPPVQGTGCFAVSAGGGCDSTCQ